MTSPAVSKGETYNVLLGGSSAESSADGLYEAGAHRPDAATGTTLIAR